MNTFMEHCRLRFLPQPSGASIRSMSRRSPSARGTIATTAWNKTIEQSTSSTERVRLRPKLPLEEASRERLQWALRAVAVSDCPLFRRLSMVFPAVLRSFRENPEARRLALIFAVVYFAQGMWYLPNLSLTFLLKETWHLSAGQTA